MKAFTILTLTFAMIMIGTQCLRTYVDDASSERATAKHAQADLVRDARLADACAKGQTGVVLFHKGIQCGK